MHSIITANQSKTYGPKFYTEYGTTYKITATVRYDDRCGNGHNSFAITGEIYRKAKNNRWVDDRFGCLHDDIAKHFPNLAPLIKWHGMTADGPIHYLENTLYHVREHGPTKALVYYHGSIDPLGLSSQTEHLIGYLPADEAKRAEGQPGYRVEWDKCTAKQRNLNYARQSAFWPDATDEDLLAPGLEERLRARLPLLLAEFRADVESLDFTY